MKQPEPEAKEIAFAIELFTDGSLNTFAKETNVDVDSRLICYVNAGCGLIKVGAALVPFQDKFPRNTKLYKLMSTKPGESEISA